MKKNFIVLIAILFAVPVSKSLAQTSKEPASCKMYYESKVIDKVTVQDAINWCEQTAPMVQCDDGKIYKIETFKINYLTLKPFMNQDFGVGEGGFPIKARMAVKNGKPGDTIIMKDVTYTTPEGVKDTLPIISFKFQE